MRRGYWDKLNSREKFLAKLYIRTSACTETAFTPRNKEIASIFEGEAEKKDKLLHEIWQRNISGHWLKCPCKNCELHSNGLWLWHFWNIERGYLECCSTLQTNTNTRHHWGCRRHNRIVGAVTNFLSQRRQLSICRSGWNCQLQQLLARLVLLAVFFSLLTINVKCFCIHSLLKYGHKVK